MFLFRILFSTFKKFLSYCEGKISAVPEYSREMFLNASSSLFISFLSASLRLRVQFFSVPPRSLSILEGRLCVQSKSSFATLLLCVQFLSLQAGFSFTPLPLEYDCAYLTLPMELDATTFDCVVGPGCSVTMTLWVSVHDSALNELYAHPVTFSHPCDLFPDFTYNFLWAQGWFDAHGFIEGDTYWIQLELLSFTANTSATQTYLFGNSLKVQLEPPVAYSQPIILTTQSFVYSPMAADFIWQKPKQNKIKALTNATITLIDQSEIFGNVDYRWYLDDSLIGTDSVITYSAPCREHEIRLEVEQVPGGCIAEKVKMIPSFGGCVSPLREGKRPFLPSLIRQGDGLVLPDIPGRKYELFDLSGRSLGLDTRQLPQGIYYLRIEQGRETKIHKFIVQ